MTVHPLVGVVDWMPDQQAAGTHDVTLVALDGFAGGKAARHIKYRRRGERSAGHHVNPSDDGDCGAAYQYQVVAVDPDGDPVTYSFQTPRTA